MAERLRKVEAGLRSAGRWVIAAEVPASTPGGDPKTRPESEIRHGNLRFAVALSIVLAAISAAAAAWRAEIFTEYASQKEALFRQDLMGQQLYERLDEEQVAAGLRHFTSYQEEALLARQLQGQADQTRGRRAAQLGVDAQNAQAAAAVRYSTDSALQAVASTTGQRGPPVADPSTGYAFTALADDALTNYDPADRAADARLARNDSVKMAGVAVLFAIAVLLLTVSEIRLRREQVSNQRWTDGHTLAVVAAGAWLVGAVLFVILMLDVITLRS